MAARPPSLTKSARRRPAARRADEKRREAAERRQRADRILFDQFLGLADIFLRTGSLQFGLRLTEHAGEGRGGLIGGLLRGGSRRRRRLAHGRLAARDRVIDAGRRGVAARSELVSGEEVQKLLCVKHGVLSLDPSRPLAIFGDPAPAENRGGASMRLKRHWNQTVTIS